MAGARAQLPGVINVRGNVIPLADIRIRSGMERRPEYIRFITRWNDDSIIVPDLERILS